MIKLLKLLLYTFLVGLFAVLLFINVKLHCGPDLADSESTKQDVIQQLNFIERELKQEDLGSKMQQFYPEGLVFVNTLYGLTWAETAITDTIGSKSYLHALAEARYAYGQINSENARSIFDKDLIPEYGIFYCGWKNFLLGKILSLQKEKDPGELAAFNADCDSIARSFSSYSSPFPESYREASWPSDAAVAIASLKLHDSFLDVRYDTLIRDWVKKIRTKLDPFTHLLPHSTKPHTGELLEGTRGSSMSLMLLFLADIDPVFAQEQFSLFKEKFTITRFGFPAIREYPEGRTGSGDVDSGPVILDISFSGTIVSIGALKKFGSYKAASKISGCIEGFGAPGTSNNEKKFLFGKMAMADTFIAWARIQSANKTLLLNKENAAYELGSFYLFHLSSILVLLLTLQLLFGKKIIQFIKNKKAQ